MLARFEYFQESDYIRMLNLFQQVDLLEDLSLAEIILHVILLYSLDSHLLTCQFVDSKCNFTEGSLAN